MPWPVLLYLYGAITILAGLWLLAFVALVHDLRDSTPYWWYSNDEAGVSAFFLPIVVAIIWPIAVLGVIVVVAVGVIRGSAGLIAKELDKRSEFKKEELKEKF